MAMWSPLNVALGFLVVAVSGTVLAIGFVCWLVAQPLVGRIASAPPPADAARLQTHVRTLSEEFYPRSFDQPRNLERAGEYIQRAFAASGAQVTAQTYSVQGTEYRNIIARFGPTAGPLFIVGAHYDAYGSPAAGARYANGFGPQSHTPGADDNASGVAGLLELARLLGRHPPRQSVELVAYTLEEPQHFRTEAMGSVQHARALRRSNRAVSLMLALEMIGYFSDAADSQAFPVSGMSLLYPNRGNFIVIVGRLSDWSLTRKVKSRMAGATALPVVSVNAPVSVPGVDFSDHRSYWAEDYPALMITDSAFYRNPNYHQASDTWETLDYRRMAQVVEAVYAVIQNFAED